MRVRIARRTMEAIAFALLHATSVLVVNIASRIDAKRCERIMLMREVVNAPQGVTV